MAHVIEVIVDGTEQAALEYLAALHDLEGLLEPEALGPVVATICEALCMDTQTAYDALLRHAETESAVDQMDAEMRAFEAEFGRPDEDDDLDSPYNFVADDFAFDGWREASL